MFNERKTTLISAQGMIATEYILFKCYENMCDTE